MRTIFAPMAVKRYTLTEDFALAELEVFALITPLKPLQLAWNLNKFHGFRFERIEDLKIGAESNPSFHPVFLQKEAESMLDFRLIRNRGTHHYLMNRHKQADYFFCTRFEEICMKPDYYSDLRQLKLFQFVFKVPESDLNEEVKWHLMKDY